MKITITRSFSRTKQVAAFEPINAFCSAEVELTIEEMAVIDKAATVTESMKYQSEELDKFVRSEVEKTIDVELAKRKSPDHPKIQDTAKAESETDAGQEALDRLLDQEAQAKTAYPSKGYREI